MSWNTIRVGESLTLINGRAFKPTEWKKSGKPIVRIQNLNNPDAPFNYFDGDLPEKFLLDDGDLLFAWSGTPGTSFGAHIWRGGQAWLNQHIFKVQFDETQFDKKFLQLAINQNLAEYIRAAHGGAGLAHITKGRFEESELPQPKIPEQRRIVAEIDKQFTRLEAGMKALRRVQANLKRYRAAVLKAACEGRLVPTEIELAKAENRKLETGERLLVRILTERHKNWQGRGQYKEPAAPDTATLDPLPDGYTWASFGQICRVQGGFAFKSSDYVKKGVPLVRISNLVNGRVQVSEDTVFLPQEFATANPAFLLRKGDVLIAMSGATTGKMATMEDDIPALLNQRVGRFVLSSSELSNARFVSYLVMRLTQKVLKDAYGAAQPNISPAEIEEMSIPLPPLAEQTRIVAEVERRLSVVEELESVVSANLQRATRMRQSILQQTFSGDLN